MIVPVITDGTEFTNRYSPRRRRRADRAERRPAHGRHRPVLPTREEHGIRERSFLLDDGPRETGGQHITLLAPTGLDQALERLARELSSQYKVVYGRPESLIPPEKVEVSSARPGVTMRGAPARGENGA